MVSMMVTRSLTSWLRSLSPLETMTSMPCAAASCASVAITSSASTPGTVSTFQPSRSTTSWMGAIWLRRSSGMGERVALYWSYMASRKVGPEASNTQTA